ncbi:hypothetical protein TELCIR_09632 [Teladorsagia circumcincta]|uniref:Uncharacterized protein n=1 Tax=Teladorsagia circumcincta TaxID=45464 RepID=A0A2G9UEI6_TELCI|nr:hypothetical protein TELCIR_09632 [Teladorsagia circumcincta]
MNSEKKICNTTTFTKGAGWAFYDYVVLNPSCRNGCQTNTLTITALPPKLVASAAWSSAGVMQPLKWFRFLVPWGDQHTYIATVLIMLWLAMSMMTVTVLSSYMFCTKRKPKMMTPSMRSLAVPPQPPPGEGSTSAPSAGEVKPPEAAPPPPAADK